MVKNNVQEFRKKQNMTQEDLATKVNVTRQTIIAIEKGNYVPSVELALKISNFFKVPVNVLFILEEESK